ncbi:hypothetical protein PsYK624_071050 [Phanerochaete sordida]|uniref:Uncharacterized protein n=1 Tax=Phanerochaete sordida TaxID=48140 RepID=A0A9P3LE03_9APHY|nr:hypothetical protein PsYK624_071050 [Phanerochaete sordida]
MQRVPKQTRKVNRWNAYLHSQVQAFNKGLDPAEPRPRVHVIAKGIRERWDAMTEEERIAATADAIVELEDIRESKQAAKKESKISSARDIRNTMDGIEAELLDLNTRTGAELLVVQIRPEAENFGNKPRIFMTSPRVGQFFELSMQHSVNDFAVKLQAFCVADIQPRTQPAPILECSPSSSTPASTATPPPPAAAPISMQQQVIEMKRKVKTIINDKLQECAYPVKIPRINYVGFETSISERHGIVCENWPLPNFCAPGGLNSLTELEILYHAWSTGVTVFRKMSPEEHQQFKDARVQHRLQAAIAQANAAALAAQHNAQGIQSPSAGPSFSPVQQPSTPGTTSASDASLQEPVAVDPSATLIYPPEFAHGAPPQSAGSAVHPQLFATPTSVAAAPMEQPVASSSAVTLESPSAPGPTTFVFSTGKRPPPSHFNILGPMGLMPKKPRKKRADAGVKRGPNKRTTGGDANGEEGEAEGPEDGQDGQEQVAAPMDVDGEERNAADVPQGEGQPAAPVPQVQYVVPDPGGTTSVFRVQAQPPMQALLPPEASEPSTQGPPPG